MGDFVKKLAEQFVLFLDPEKNKKVNKHFKTRQQFQYSKTLPNDMIHSLDQSIQNLNQLPEEDSVVLSSICQTISTLTVDQVEDPESNFDFSGLRLDWARLQVSFYTYWLNRK